MCVCASVSRLPSLVRRSATCALKASRYVATNEIKPGQSFSRRPRSFAHRTKNATAKAEEGQRVYGRARAPTRATQESNLIFNQPSHTHYQALARGQKQSIYIHKSPATVAAGDEQQQQRRVEAAGRDCRLAGPFRSCKLTHLSAIHLAVRVVLCVLGVEKVKPLSAGGHYQRAIAGRA